MRPRALVILEVWVHGLPEHRSSKAPRGTVSRKVSTRRGESARGSRCKKRDQTLLAKNVWHGPPPARPEAAHARSAPSARSWSISTKPEEVKCRRGTRSSSSTASMPSRQVVSPENRSRRARGRCGLGGAGARAEGGMGNAGAATSAHRTDPPGKGPPAPGECMTTIAPMETHWRIALSTSPTGKDRRRDEGCSRTSVGRSGERPETGSAWERQKEARRSEAETVSDCEG